MFSIPSVRRSGRRSASAVLAAGLVLALALPALGQGRPSVIWMAGGHSGGVGDLALSPDNQSLATASFDSTAKLFDLSTGLLRSTLAGHSVAALAVDYSPDGTRVATADYGGSVFVWDAATGARVGTLTGHTDAVLAVAYSPDGTMIASGSADGAVKLWNAATGAPIRTLTGHAGWVYSVAFSPDSATVASGSGDQTIRLWRVSDGAHTGTLSGHTGFVLSVEFAPSGAEIVSASNDNTTRLWRVSDGAQLGAYTEQTMIVYSAAFSPDGARIASGAGDGTIVIRRTSDGSVERTIPLPVGVQDLAYASDGSAVYAGCDDGSVTAWSATDGSFVRSATAHFGTVAAVAVSPDSMLVASGAWDYTVRLSGLADGHTVGVFTDHTDAVTSVAFSPDGALLASGSYDATAIIRQVSDGAIVRTITGHTLGVTSVAFSPDGSAIATGSSDTTIKLWRLSDGAELGSFAGHFGDVVGMAFSPDGQRLASVCTDGTVRCWNVATFSQVWSATASDAWVLSVAFSPDGTQVATGSAETAGGSLRTWNAADGTPAATASGHVDPVRSLVYSPDGLVIATGGNHGDEGRLQFWLAAGLGLLQTYDEETGTGMASYGVTAVAYSPNQHAVVYGRSDAAVVSCANPFWPVPTSLSVVPTTGQIGEIVTLKADLTVTISGAPIMGKAVTFSVAGSAVGTGETDIVGRARCDFRIPEALGISEQVIGVAFAGDDAYTPATGAGTLTITRANTGLTADRVVGILGDTVTLRATLIRTTDDSPLAGRGITFKVENTPAGSGVTDALGIATVDFVIPLNLGAGDKTITVNFAGDGSHLQCTGYGTLVTSKRPTVLAASDLAGQIGSAVTLQAALTMRTVPVEGAAIGFAVAGTQIGIASTGSDGVARMGYPIPEGSGPGDRAIAAEFAGDAVNDRSSDIALLTVLRTDTLTYVPELARTGSVGLDVVLRGYLYRATDKAGLAGRTLAFLVAGTPAGSAVTSDAGRATAYYTLPVGTQSSDLEVNAAFAGDATYGSSSGSGTLRLTVTRLGTIMWVMPRIAVAGTSTYLRAFLRRTLDYSWLPGKDVTIALDGSDVGTAPTDAGGRASVLYAVPSDFPTGEHTVTGTFAGDDEYLGSTANNWMIVF
jgi:WD40 repeat protein